MSAVIIPLHTTRQAKAEGVFAAINIAARRMGYSDELALRAARKAKQDVLSKAASPARIYSTANAELRMDAPKVLA